MKHLILAVALVGCIVACNTEKQSVGDPASPTAPKAESCEGMKEGSCTEGQKAECSGMKKSCCTEGTKPQG